MAYTWPISSEIRPLNAQLPSLRESASEKGKALEDCRIRMAAIEDQLKTLCIHEAELDRVYEGARTLLALIRRLPDDILRAILEEAYPFIKRQTDEGINPRSMLNIWTDQSQLRLVCRRWTRIINDTLSFWSEIVMGRWFPSCFTELCIERFKSSLLDIFLFGDFVATPRLALTTLLKIADQVRLLSIQCHQGIEVLESFEKINPLQMPTLRILSSVVGLGLLCQGQSAMTSTSMLALEAPNLLSLDPPTECQLLPRLSTKCLAKLQRLQADFKDPDRLLKLSEVALNLKVIKLKIWASGPSMKVGPIHFPKLNSLSITKSDLTHISDTLRRLKIPQIRKINLEPHINSPAFHLDASNIE
ncbi:hypothetical protein M422DRAFT_51284 [Sphaerobolus stellatus SS14]|uniref:F-box domain-containing protein n=1 Tax=Sphaerobolus stellatus (strain SS14) TaxID=990650 RepID=A0A0C9U004_SPHS4|nr:hypothetical protein M422DRAFT_51284 [Sphaerobolus stellatus SS14]